MPEQPRNSVKAPPCGPEMPKCRAVNVEMWYGNALQCKPKDPPPFTSQAWDAQATHFGPEKLRDHHQSTSWKQQGPSRRTMRIQRKNPRKNKRKKHHKKNKRKNPRKSQGKKRNPFLPFLLPPLPTFKSEISRRGSQLDMHKGVRDNCFADDSSPLK